MVKKIFIDNKGTRYKIFFLNDFTIFPAEILKAENKLLADSPPGLNFWMEVLFQTVPFPPGPDLRPTHKTATYYIDNQTSAKEGGS